MTRFMQEVSGALGEYWQRSAEQELAEIREEIAKGLITIDSNGVAYNRVGRVLMDDMAEKVAYVNGDIDIQATAQARAKETKKEIDAYRESMKNWEPSAEELFEMRAAFGKGATVVNVLTGKKIRV